MNLYETALNYFENAGNILGIDKKILKIIEEPEKVVQAKLIVEGESFKAYRVDHNTSRGPAKGGIRFHPMVNLEEVEGLAFLMSIKNSVANLPYGGGKGGIAFDPKKRDDKFLEKISRAYVREMFEVFGQDKDVPAPDVYTNPKIMAWMLDEYEKIARKKEPGFITGKPILLGGSLLRNIATSLGGYFVLKELIKGEKTVAIQGYGNAGRNIAEILYKDGFKILAVSDSKGGIYDRNGLNIPEISKKKDETGSVGNNISNEELLELDVDILIPAAIEGVINEKNADNIKAKIILELANGPITPKAHKILVEKGILVVPDVLANSGGVTVSYFEWVQNRMGYYWKDEELREKLREKMVNSLKEVRETAQKYNTDLRMGAFILALERIYNAMKMRGWI